MKKIMLVFGTRPEAIKMAPLVKELKKYKNYKTIVCVTAQHREMLDQVLEIFDIIPDFDLDIMKQCQTLITITNNVMNELDKVYKEVNPDLVLVHGDTSTTFVGSLAAFYNKIPVGHVEAGLRSFDNFSPFPEEMNRKLTGNIAELHFAPTMKNKLNLEAEGITKNVYITGNTVIDALQHTVKSDYVFKNNKLRLLDFEKQTILLTAHRRENLGTPLENICRAVKKLIETHQNIQVVYPVHLNPVVQETVNNILGNVERVNLIDPIDVEDMHNVMSKSYFVMTDSGGIQEEAPSLGKPVLVLRTETERPEAVEAGTVNVVGVEEKDIYEMASKLLLNDGEYNNMAMAVNPYGDGKASNRIAVAINDYFNI